jgi:hypothetical protein
MATVKELENTLVNATEVELNILGDRIYNDLQNNPGMKKDKRESSEWFLHMIVSELERRPIEPLWRKAKRFAVRNSSTIKEVGKIAACLGIGALIGIDLSNA